jgi:hypothetical protein
MMLVGALTYDSLNLPNELSSKLIDSITMVQFRYDTASATAWLVHKPKPRYLNGMGFSEDQRANIKKTRLKEIVLCIETLIISTLKNDSVEWTYICSSKIIHIHIHIHIHIYFTTCKEVLHRL